MKDVVISIHSIHGYDLDQEEERIDFTTDGLYSYENGVSRLSYMESEVTGLPGTRTSVEVSPEGIVVMGNEGRGVTEAVARTVLTILREREEHT